jgi:hypothetical protein
VPAVTDDCIDALAVAHRPYELAIPWSPMRSPAVRPPRDESDRRRIAWFSRMARQLTAAASRCPS